MGTEITVLVQDKEVTGEAGSGPNIEGGVEVEGAVSAVEIEAAESGVEVLGVESGVKVEGAE